MPHAFALPETRNELRPVPGWEGLYSVTADGRVWSHGYQWRNTGHSATEHAGKWLTPWLTLGYPCVGLSDRNGAKKKVMVHRIVASAWVQNEDPERRKHVNHINGVKTDNHYTNLEWCTQRHNNQHARMVLHHAGNGRRVSYQQAVAYRERRAAGERVMDLAAEAGMSDSAMSHLLAGKTYRYAGWQEAPAP